ncbi:uncharacterized protein LOC143037732 [Oratosquilla oratoria]|uniref:uncharacterized protein LOC143037732 n=1 Tax=Oratosquilla oratoria TaxID=337810 RepID=UPI003F76041C
MPRIPLAMVWMSSLLLIVQTYVALTDAVVNDICKPIIDEEGYHTNASSLCNRHGKNNFSCNHQLRGLPEARLCTLRYIDSEECQMENKVKMYNYSVLPFSLTAYHFSNWMINKTSFNLSFPTPGWSHLKFQYHHQDPHVAHNTVCRNFELNLKPTTSISDTLFWDCDFSDETNYHNNCYKLVLMDSEGYGGEYRFRVPDVKRIDRSTSIKDWEVFQFLHMSYISEYGRIPVTIQLAPFKQVFYNVTLVQCSDHEEDECRERKTIAYQVINGSSRFETTEIEDGHRTVVFEHQNEVGKFAVVVQIIEADCQCAEGCFSSISPIFVFSHDLQLLATFICVIVLMGIFLMLTWFAWKCRIKIKEVIQKRQQHKKSVLLVYSVTFAAYFDFIKELANYLQQRFQMHILYVDKDTAGQDPSLWIEETIHISSKVLFLVSDSSQGAVTPIRNQWDFALSVYNEFYCKDDLYHNKFAVVTFPFSASVPAQIHHLRRFYLMDELSLLVTWIHNGSILEKYLLLEPLVSILKPIKTERNRLKSMVTIITREVKSMSDTTSFTDITTITSPVNQKNDQCQEVECNGNIKAQLSYDGCNTSESSVGSEAKFEPIEDVFDEAIPRPQFLPIFGDEPHVHCATKSVDIDPALRDAFFGI